VSAWQAGHRGGQPGLRVALGLGLALLAATPARAQEQRPPVVVTDPTARGLLAAVQLFADRAGASDRSRTLREAIVSGLEFSTLFRSIDPKAFLAGETTQALDGGSPVVCSDWKAIGTDVLVEGELWSEGADSLYVEYRAWDVARCRGLVRKRYHGGNAEVRTIALRIADEIVGAFTGRNGVASTELAFVSTRTGSKEIHVMNADGTGLRRATTSRSINAFPSWSSDGQAIVYTSYREERRPNLFMLSRGGSSPGRILRSVLNGAPQYRGVFAPQGRRLAFVASVDGSSEIFSVNADGSGLRRLTRDRAIDVSPTWSPDGQRIAFVSDRAGSPQVYLMDADGGEARRLTFDGSYNTAPAWSPDGRWIAYETRIDGQFDIWLIDPEGTVNAPLVSHPQSDETPAWSPDSRLLAFSSKRRGPADIYVVDLSGQNERRLTQGGENTNPAWGPYPR
jgi:TolB protein